MAEVEMKPKMLVPVRDPATMERDKERVTADDKRRSQIREMIVQGSEMARVHKSVREQSRSRSRSKSPPTMIVGSRPLTIDDERRVRFKNVARIKLVPSDQLPARPVRMDRSVSNPKRRLWVLYRLCQVGGRYFPNPRNRDEPVYIPRNSQWPTKWGKPPPPPAMIPIKEPVENESLSDDSISFKRK